MRKCSACFQVKNLGDFHADKRGKDGVSYACKECKALRSKNYYNNNKKPVRNQQIKYRYGITESQYNDMFKSQQGACKICLAPATIKLAVDHCHRTGRIRGLLCSKCNHGIGLFQDSSALLEKASEYLK